MIDVCDDLGIESFFEHVLNRMEEILGENSNVSSEHRISTHVDLLERTVNPEKPPPPPLGAARAKRCCSAK